MSNLLIVALIFSTRYLSLGIGSYFNEYFLNNTSEYNLVVFFNNEDCEVCLNEIESFNKLKNKIHVNNLSITGVLNSNSKEDAIKFAKKNDIQFTLIADENVFMKHDIKTQKTPFYVVVDTKRKSLIIYQSFSKKESSSQSATYEIINLIVRNQN